jgi:hypothetical protein
MSIWERRVEVIEEGVRGRPGFLSPSFFTLLLRLFSKSSSTILSYAKVMVQLKRHGMM